MTAAKETWHYFWAGYQDRQTLYARVTPRGTVEQPYSGRRECLRDARENGATAVFHATEREARMAACGRCDCADPLAIPGLSADCSCTCHRHR